MANFLFKWWFVLGEDTPARYLPPLEKRPPPPHIAMTDHTFWCRDSPRLLWPSYSLSFRVGFIVGPCAVTWLCMVIQQRGVQCNTLNQCGTCEEGGLLQSKRTKEKCFCFVCKSCEIAVNYIYYWELFSSLQIGFSCMMCVCQWVSEDSPTMGFCPVPQMQTFFFFHFLRKKNPTHIAKKKWLK